MAWQASVLKTERSQDVFNVTIQYTNGIETFRDLVQSQKLVDDTWLATVMADRLTQLDLLDKTQQTIESKNLTEKAYEIDAETKELIEVEKIAVTPAESAIL